jgi:hypothetical protein
VPGTCVVHPGVQRRPPRAPATLRRPLVDAADSRRRLDALEQPAQLTLDDRGTVGAVRRQLFEHVFEIIGALAR